MKKLVLIASALAVSLPLLAQNFPLQITGDFNNWGNSTGSGPVMSDMGGGVWQVGLSGLTAGAHWFKITQGDWGWNTPANNAWFFADGSGNATISINLNNVSDGWTYPLNRITENNDPGSWTAVGAWNGWTPTDPTAVMTPIGGGIYELVKTIATPGAYGFKATQGGAWNYQIGADGRNNNASELTFTTTDPNQEVDMFMNILNGTLSVNVVAVPEPATAALLGLGGLVAVGGLIRRRK